MSTAVGKQEDFSSALIELVELDYDAVEAYEAALKRLEDEKYRNMLEKFKIVGSQSSYLRSSNRI